MIEVLADSSHDAALITEAVGRAARVVKDEVQFANGDAPVEGLIVGCRHPIPPARLAYCVWGPSGPPRRGVRAPRFDAGFVRPEPGRSHDTHADSHPVALAHDEAAATTAAQGACAPYVSGGPGNPAIGSLSGSDCMNFTGLPFWPFGGCELCFCYYDVAFGNGDDGTYATWAVDCSFV